VTICAKATAAGDPSYRTIKGILAAGTETAPAPRSGGDGGQRRISTGWNARHGTHAPRS
jgi:hypothetical protein